VFVLVRDHNYNGSLLMPAVFGMEAMAQAAALAFPGSRLGPWVQAREVVLERPVTVAPGAAGSGVLVWAQVVEGSGAGGQPRIRCGVRHETTGYKRWACKLAGVVGDR
jgi:enediyne polyketide synthase